MTVVYSVSNKLPKLRYLKDKKKILQNIRKAVIRNVSEKREDLSKGSKSTQLTLILKNKQICAAQHALEN